MEEDEVVWEDPPPHVNKKVTSPVSEAKREAMREHPGKWQRVKTFNKGYKASQVSTDIRKKKFDDFPDPQEWQMRTKREKDDEGNESSTLWMRYMGAGSEQADDDVLEELDQPA